MGSVFGSDLPLFRAGSRKGKSKKEIEKEIKRINSKRYKTSPTKKIKKPKSSKFKIGIDLDRINNLRENENW